MCTTTRYLYLCSHPATYRFRTSLCPLAKSTSNPTSPVPTYSNRTHYYSAPKCRIADTNTYLPAACPKCAGKSRTRNGKQAGEQIRKMLDREGVVKRVDWYVPSRCFIDAGFSNLDPFGTGLKDAKAGEFAEGEMEEQGQGQGRRRQPSPCCEKARRMGPYQSTRLEGEEDRMRGRIVDSFCGSWI
jgi:hypothetical protein